MAGEGTLEEVTILDLEGRREGRQGKCEGTRQHTHAFTVRCCSLRTYCVRQPLGQILFPPLRMGRQTSRHTDLLMSGREACFEEE